VSATEILDWARCAGIGVVLDGDNIVLEAPAQPPMELLDAFRKHKPDLVTLLRSGFVPPQSPTISPAEFLKAVKRSGAKLFPVGGRLELRGEEGLQVEFQRHRLELEKIVGAERLGGIAAEVATATASMLLGFGACAQLLTTIPEATASIHRLLAATGDGGVIGADIETTPLALFAVPRPPLNITADGSISSKQPAWKNDAGLDPYRAEVRVLSLWNPRAGDVRVIDLRNVPLAVLPQELWRTRLVFHNATFDTKHLLHAGVPLQPDKPLCSMLVAGLVARGEPSKSHEGKRRPSLAVAAKELLGIDVPKAGQTADWDVPSLDPARADYAALDAVLAYQILKVGVATMSSRECRALDIACGCIHAVARLELAGLPFDAARHRVTAKTWAGQLRNAETKAKELTGIANLMSPVQIEAWLKRTLPSRMSAQWPRTDGGKLSTKGKVLHRYAKHHPGLQAIAEYAKLRTLNTSFGLSLLDQINPRTRRLHTSLQIAQAKSGRFSSKDPNLQNIPRDGLMRRAVRAPDGALLIVADYSQIELRVMAEVTRDQRMRDAYADGLDLHIVTAAGMLGIPIDEFDRTRPDHADARQKAKGLNFGIVYGCGASGLVTFARDNYNVTLTEAEAKRLIAAWLRTYPGVRHWQLRHVARSRSRRAVQTPAGRIYHFAWEPKGRFNPNLALNLPIQGGAAEVAQLAIAKTDALLTRHLGERARLVGQVHDEFLVLADEAVAEQAKRLLVQAMTEAFADSFPDAPVRNLVDAEVAVDWAAAKV
jgi:DNA polymerase I-like protein with 3'-5' exonuclease and polymerase domains